MSKKIWTILLFAILFFASASTTKAQVLINEFSSYDSPGDWVELYAIETTDISGWHLRDTSATNDKIIPEGTMLNAGSFYIIEYSNYLDKSGDVIYLKKADNSTVVDSIPYGDEGGVCAPGSGESVGRYPDGYRDWETDRKSVV